MLYNMFYYCKLFLSLRIMFLVFEVITYKWLIYTFMSMISKY